MTVRHLLLCPPSLYLSPDAAVGEVISMMIQREVNHIPLCESNGRYLGLVSSNAILRALLPDGIDADEDTSQPDQIRTALSGLIDSLRNDQDRPARELIDASLQPLDQNSPILEATRRLAATNAPLAVIDDQGFLVGLLSRRLLLTHLLDKSRPI